MAKNAADDASLPGAAAAAAGHVRAAAATIERAKRGRTEGKHGEREHPDTVLEPDMMFDVASNTMVSKESLPDERPATKSHVMGLLAQLQLDMEGTMEKATKAAVSAANNTLKAELFEHFGNLLSSYDEQSEKRFTAIEEEATETKTELDRHKKDLEALKKDFARLADTVGVAAKTKPSRSELAAVTWDEPADPATLLINTEDNAMVAKSAVKDALKGWLKDSCIGDDGWRLEGQELDRRFKLVFAGGDTGYAALRANKAFGCLRVGGEFRPMLAKAAGKEGNVKLYIKRNQNQKEQRTERDGKRFFKALQPKLSGRQVAFTKKEGAIAVDWRLVVRVVPHPSDEPSTLQFNMPALRDLQLDKNIFVEAFATIGSTSKINWSL